MSRFRSRLSRDASPEDQALQDLIRRAMREIQEALGIVGRSRDDKAKAMAKNLGRILSELDSVGNLSSSRSEAIVEEKHRLLKEALKAKQEEVRRAKEKVSR